MLNIITSHIPLLPRSRRQTLQAIALASRSLHTASDLLLWSRPRDLDTVEHQVQFAFGVAISGGLSDSLGNYVERLRIRWMKGGWNSRLIQKTVALCPGIRDLTIHWGDCEDGLDPATPTSNSILHSVLSSLPNLRHLYLCKFSSTPTHEEDEFAYPPDAHVPFSRLESLNLYGFTWYWPNIARGLSNHLKTLEIGSGTFLSVEQLNALPATVPSLTTLRLSCSVDLSHVQAFVSHAPGLECVDITQFSEKDEAFVTGVLPALMQLRNLKEVAFNTPIDPSQIAVLANSPRLLQSVNIKLQDNSSQTDVEEALHRLIDAKQQTLMALFVSFEGSFLLTPSDVIVTALSGCPQLERIGIDFSSDLSRLSSASVDRLLLRCPKLLPSGSLEGLCEGNALYEKEYRQVLEAASLEVEEMWEEDILGN